MNIAYNKDTLYVYLDGHQGEVDFDMLEKRVDDIMSAYEIESLVIESGGYSKKHMHEFEWNYNKRHRNKVVVK